MVKLRNDELNGVCIALMSKRDMQQLFFRKFKMEDSLAV